MMNSKQRQIELNITFSSAVPGGADGPGGVLILCENIVIWKHQGQQEVRAVIPRRRDLDQERSVLIVSATAHKQKVFYKQ